MNVVAPPDYSRFLAGSDGDPGPFPERLARLWDALNEHSRTQVAGDPKWVGVRKALVNKTKARALILRTDGWSCDDVVELARHFPDGIGSLGCDAEGVIRREWAKVEAQSAEAERAAAAAAAEAAEHTKKVEEQTSKPTLLFVSPASLQGKPVPERQWIVRDWLPVGYTTLNYADGGSGKTLVAQQLMTSCATGGHWLGLDVERCRSIALFCEDDEDELHRRQAAICDAYGIQMRDLDDMKWTSGVGEDNTLVLFDEFGEAVPTERFVAIENAAVDFGARLVIIDTAADTFGGNENDRRQVRQFIGKICGGLARKINGAVLVNAHPSRQGMQTGDLDGGSTAWSNSARSRWSMARPKGEGIPADTDERILTRRKANYAAIGEDVRLRWEKGVFVPEGAARTTSGGVGREAVVDAVFLDLLARCTASKIWVSHKLNAGNFAPRVFATRPDRKGFTKAEFALAMNRMLADGRVVLEAYGRPGDDRQRLARGAEAAS